jgi:three-Cys-motif partner protein
MDLSAEGDMMATRKWGWWTRNKLQILEDYLAAFAIASKRQEHRIYLDLFAGRPDNESRETGETVLGSAHRAIGVQPPFTRIGLFELERNAKELNTAIRDTYPDTPGIKVFPGDCNDTIRQALRELAPVNWAPTFAFVDQYASELRWSTLEQIARFRRGKTKAEMWILFAPGMYGRGLAVRKENMNARYGEKLSEMIGGEQWVPIVNALRADRLAPAEAYEKWVNLFRWRLATVLGYQHTHNFTMKNTSGRHIYEMIFASDHPVGDKIMRDVYGAAARRSRAMHNHALAIRKEQRLEKNGAQALFPIDPCMTEAPAIADSQLYEPSPLEPPYGSGD